MPINPYLHFQGGCKTAMEAYQAILGGTLETMPYSRTEGEPGADRIMHAALMTPHGDLQGSDYPPGMEGSRQASVSVHVQLPTVAEGKRVFEALADGGAVIEAFAPSFFSPGFGMCGDRFGTHWIVSVTPGG